MEGKEKYVDGAMLPLCFETKVTQSQECLPPQPTWFAQAPVRGLNFLLSIHNDGTVKAGPKKRRSAWPNVARH